MKRAQSDLRSLRPALPREWIGRQILLLRRMGLFLRPGFLVRTSGVIGLEIVTVVDVGDPDDEYAHSATGSMDDAWGNVDHRPLLDRMLDPVKQHSAFSVQHVVELGRPLVIMGSCTVDVRRACAQAAGSRSTSSRLINRSRQPQALRSRAVEPSWRIRV